MRVEWLETFLAVVDRGGFGAAALHLYRSQGRVSTYIASLERELGAELFNRDVRPVRLTSAGEAWVPHARAILREIEAGRSTLESVNGLGVGAVSIATYPSAGAAFLPEVFHRFSETFPGIRVVLREAAVYGIDQMLDHAETMIAIRPTSPPVRIISGIRHRVLWRENMVAVVPDGHELCGRDCIDLVELADFGLVVSGQHLQTDSEAVRMLAGAGTIANVLHVTDTPQTLVGLARTGDAVGFTNQLAVTSIRTEGVRVIPIAWPAHRDVAVYWTSSLESSPAATAMLKVILETPVPAGTVDLRPTEESDATDATERDSLPTRSGMRIVTT